MNSMEINDLVGLGKITESTVKALDKSFGPLFKPLIEEAGKAISDPIRRIRFERELQWYERLQQAGHYIEASGKEIHPVNPKLLLPIAEYATLETDAYLQELWSKLLATALVEEDLHPCYAEVLKQLNSLDAKVFTLVDTPKEAEIRNQTEYYNDEYYIFLKLASEFDASDLAKKIKQADKAPKPYKKFTLEDCRILEEKEIFVQESIENLHRLGLLSDYKKRKHGATHNGNLVIPWGISELHHSPFGIRFLRVVSGPKPNR